MRQLLYLPALMSLPLPKEIPSYRPTWATIHRAALLQNLAVVRRCCGKNPGILAMVKADAYGHGAAQVAQWLAAEGVVAFGVATIEEGIELRTAEIAQPVLVMEGLLGPTPAAAQAVIEHGLTCVVSSVEELRVLGAAATKPVEFHMHIDTGMHRLGITPDAVPQLLAALAETPHLQLTGAMTHLACSDDIDFTALQLSQFTEILPQLRAVASAPLVIHCANSGALLQGSATSPLDLAAGETWWVRPGVMLYGIEPYAGAAVEPLQPVMQVQTHVMFTKAVPEGSAVSYGATWVAQRPTRIAVLPIGYADGIPWQWQGGTVLMQGQSVPIVGRITMDMIMCDITDMPKVAVGEPVVLLGNQGATTIRAETIAQSCGTIPYEIVCGISARMPRRFKT